MISVARCHFVYHVVIVAATRDTFYLFGSSWIRTWINNYSRVFLWGQNTRPYPNLWRHQMETFSALLAICTGNSPGIGEFPAQRTVTRSFDVFFDLRVNKRLSKQSWGWWSETPSCPLWRHSNEHGFNQTACGVSAWISNDNPHKKWIYRQISNMRGTKSQSLNDSHLVLKSSLPNPLKPGVKSRMKM